MAVYSIHGERVDAGEVVGVGGVLVMPLGEGNGGKQGVVGAGGGLAPLRPQRRSHAAERCGCGGGERQRLRVGLRLLKEQLPASL